MEAERADLRPWRRLFHAGNGLVISFLPPLLGVDTRTVVLMLSALLVVLMAGDIVRLRSPKLNETFFALFPSFASTRERTHVASSTWYLLGAILVLALFPARLAVPAIVVLALADPAASIVGRLWGRRKLGKGSVLGTSVFVVVAAAVLSAFFPVPVAVAAAVVVAAVEILPWRVDDNLSVPLAAAAALWLLGA